MAAGAARPPGHGGQPPVRFPHAGVWEEAAMGDAVRYAAGRDYRRLVYVYTAKEQESRVNIDAQRRRYEGFGPRPPPFLVSKPMWWPSRTIFPPSAP
ncbi:MAG: hypothetical protein ACLU9S_09025 [Oscillospiraceae bacterium]